MELHLSSPKIVFVVGVQFPARTSLPFIALCSAYIHTNIQDTRHTIRATQRVVEIYGPITVYNLHRLGFVIMTISCIYTTTRHRPGKNGWRKGP